MCSVAKSDDLECPTSLIKTPKDSSHNQQGYLFIYLYIVCYFLFYFLKMRMLSISMFSRTKTSPLMEGVLYRTNVHCELDQATNSGWRTKGSMSNLPGYTTQLWICDHNIPVSRACCPATSFITTSTSLSWCWTLDFCCE